MAEKPVHFGITSCAHATQHGLVGTTKLSSVFAHFAGAASADHAPRPAPLKRRTLLAVGLSASLSGCEVLRPALSVVPDSPPPLPREFRAAWVATVANIDWPARPGQGVATQREQALAIIERAQELGLNALILQVRPAADAIYPTGLEPWAEWLSGTQGRADEPAWDPLAYWVAECHRRGLQLHAWFNPFRARHSAAKSPIAAQHVARRRADWVRSYGDQLWLDPALPEAAAHSLAVVRDVLLRYDVDGVHIDDYFYPYPIKGGNGDELPFPDAPLYRQYREAGGTQEPAEWRREAVNRFVRELQALVRATKPWVTVGISPFGLPRPDLRPAGIEGFSQFDKLFADVELWVEKGWCDYLVPQLYWPRERKAQAYEVLLDYWLQRSRLAGNERRHVWAGLFSSSVGRAANPWPADEVLAQVAMAQARAQQEPLASGQVHFSMAALMADRNGLASRLREQAYAGDALVPAMPWLQVAAPPAPAVFQAPGQLRLWPGAGEQSTHWAVWRQLPAGGWRFEAHPAATRSLALPAGERLWLQAVGRTGKVSQATALVG